MWLKQTLDCSKKHSWAGEQLYCSTFPSKKTELQSAPSKVRSTQCCSTEIFQAAELAVSSPSPSNAALSEILATLTGYCVLIGSVFRSIPQIIRIVSNSSVEGLSLTSFVSELIAYSVMWAYNFNLGYPFSTFGEIVACWFQDILLVGLVLYYRRQVDLKLGFWTAVFVIFMWLIMTNTCGSSILYTLQASTIAMIALGARMPQIVMNYKRGNSGELSLLTCLANVMGCFARMFTTIVLTKDTLNLVGAGIQAALNGVLLYQTVQTAQLFSKKLPAEGKSA